MQKKAFNGRVKYLEKFRLLKSKIVCYIINLKWSEFMLRTNGILRTKEKVDAHILYNGEKTIRKPKPGNRYKLKISVK